MGVSPFLYTNIQHISAKSKCPPSGLEISLFLIFYTWQSLAQNSKKIAHRTHGIHKICTTCFCESLRRLREIITPRMVLCFPWIAFPLQVRTATFSSVWKNLTQRRKGREALRTFVLMSKILHADNAEPRRRFAELCAFAWEENMSFCSYVKKIFHTELTEYTEFCVWQKYWIGAPKMRVKKQWQ